jgi:hypothetical protein
MCMHNQELVSNVIKHGADKGEGEDIYFRLIRNHIGPVNIVIVTLLCPDGKKETISI